MAKYKKESAAEHFRNNLVAGEIAKCPIMTPLGRALIGNMTVYLKPNFRSDLLKRLLMKQPEEGYFKRMHGNGQYKYFLVPTSRRKQAILQHCIRYHADSFETPDTGYSLHTSLDELVKFYMKERKINGGLRRPLTQEYYSPEIVYLTEKVYEKVKKKSRGKSGVFIITNKS